MKIEKSNEFKNKLLTVHEFGLKDKTRKPADNEFMVCSGATIGISNNAGEVIKTAAQDFVDYLKVSMELEASVVTQAETTIQIALAKDAGVDLGEVASYKGFKIETDAKGIRIYAHDERGAAQALYYIEDLMYFAKAPLLAYGEISKKPMYSPQMIHSSYGMDEFPDAYLARVAHEGRDAILVFTKDVNCVPAGYLDFNDLIRRAAKYGLDVYAYSYYKSEMHPDDPGAEEYYENSYGRLFRECPGLKGVTLVGESVGFPSHDPNVSWSRESIEGIPSRRTHPGWYPCEDYPQWLNLVKRVIRKYNADADIVFWTYNWGFQPEELRVKLIESLPTDVSLLVTYEMFEAQHIGSATTKCADYTLSFEGPGAYFVSEAKAAKKRGIRLYSMTNTGGLTWDIGVIPYQPMPYQWMRRYEGMQKAHDAWGLCGLMECHHYGFYPSFISKLSKHCFFEPREPMENILKKILVAEFGEANYELVDSAMHDFSEAIRHYTASNGDQYGAFRIGPSCPFWLIRPFLGAEPFMPNSPDSVFGSRYCSPVYIDEADPQITPLGVRIVEEIKSLKTMLFLMERGVASLYAAKERNEKLDKLTGLGHFIANCVKTGIRAKEWHVLKSRQYVETTKEGLSAVYDEMEALLKAEIENAKDTIPLVEQDSRLGWEPTMLYMTDRARLEWKIHQVEYILTCELANLRKGLEL